MPGEVHTIAVCIPRVPFVTGGAELLASDLCRELLARNYDATTISIPFQWHPREQILQSCLMWRLLDLSEINGRKVDLVIAIKFPAYVVRHERKVVWLCHQFRQVYDLLGTEFSDFRESPPDLAVRDLVARTDAMAFGEAQAVFTISKTVSNRLRTYNDFTGTPLYHPPPDHERYRPGEMGDYILSVGRLDPIKRVGPLIEALRFAHEKLRCIVVGVGSDRARVEALVAKHDLEPRVQFIPTASRDELVELYSGALAVYYAPFEEDLGYVTLEAFLAGKPVVTAADSGGPTEFVKDGQTGLVSPLEPRALAAGLNRLHDDREWAAELGAAGLRSIEAITWDNVIGQLVGS